MYRLRLGGLERLEALDELAPSTPSTLAKARVMSSASIVPSQKRSNLGYETAASAALMPISANSDFFEVSSMRLLRRMTDSAPRQLNA